MRYFTPFTQDHRPAILLPNNCWCTELLMARAHRKGQVGAVVTVAKFRMAGFWTSKAGKLAKKIKSCCVFCLYLDHQPINQIMGTFPKERFVNPVARGDAEID